MISYRVDDEIATITIDDGKVNVLSLPLLTELNAALDGEIAELPRVMAPFGVVAEEHELARRHQVLR